METTPKSVLVERQWRASYPRKLINRDPASLDTFWLSDESLEKSDNLLDPDVLAQEIVEDLETGCPPFSFVNGSAFLCLA